MDEEIQIRTEELSAKVNRLKHVKLIKSKTFKIKKFLFNLINLLS